MYSGLVAGTKIEAKDTALNRSCGVTPGARGWIRCVANGRGSIYIERGVPGAGSIEGVCLPEVIAHNFLVFENHTNAGYKRSYHYTKRYPQDFIG